jgi:secondary thiamine-phosphate synthase enzyme
MRAATVEQSIISQFWLKSSTYSEISQNGLTNRNSKHYLGSYAAWYRGFPDAWQKFSGTAMNTLWLQRDVRLPALQRGFHLITTHVTASLPELPEFEVGLLHVFLQHTSASLSINENADPDVPEDLESALSAIAPEAFPYRHTIEGPDDMPAHVKASLLGNSLIIPVAHGRLCLGTWQGIYLCEHRNAAQRRKIVLTLSGTRD